MELKVPLVVVQHGRRLVEAWVPALEGVSATGPSLAEIKDDLRLKVMERFVEARPWRNGRLVVGCTRVARCV